MATITKGKYLSTPLGIHRLTKNPYDDSEIFKSGRELLEYCKSGAAYRGQRVALQMEDNTHEFVISGLLTKDIPSEYDATADRTVDLVTKYVPVLIPKGFEYTIDTENQMILMYYWNSDAIFTPYHIYANPAGFVSNLNTTKNPLNFSIMDFVDIFTLGTYTGYKLKIRYVANSQALWSADNSASAIVDEKIFTINSNPIVQQQSLPYTKASGTIADVTRMQLNLANEKFWLETDVNNIGFLPKVSDPNHVGEIWLYAPDYIKALGRGYY